MRSYTPFLWFLTGHREQINTRGLYCRAISAHERDMIHMNEGCGLIEVSVRRG